MSEGILSVIEANLTSLDYSELEALALASSDDEFLSRIADTGNLREAGVAALISKGGAETLLSLMDSITLSAEQRLDIILIHSKKANPHERRRICSEAVRKGLTWEHLLKVAKEGDREARLTVLNLADQEVAKGALVVEIINTLADGVTPGERGVTPSEIFDCIEYDEGPYYLYDDEGARKVVATLKNLGDEGARILEELLVKAPLWERLWEEAIAHNDGWAEEATVDAWNRAGILALSKEAEDKIISQGGKPSYLGELYNWLRTEETLSLETLRELHSALRNFGGIVGDASTHAAPHVWLALEANPALENDYLNTWGVELAGNTYTVPFCGSS